MPNKTPKTTKNTKGGVTATMSKPNTNPPLPQSIPAPPPPPPQAVQGRSVECLRELPANPPGRDAPLDDSKNFMEPSVCDSPPTEGLSLFSVFAPPLAPPYRVPLENASWSFSPSFGNGGLDKCNADVGDAIEVTNAVKALPDTPDPVNARAAEPILLEEVFAKASAWAKAAEVEPSAEGQVFMPIIPGQTVSLKYTTPVSRAFLTPAAIVTPPQGSGGPEGNETQLSALETPDEACFSPSQEGVGEKGDGKEGGEAGGAKSGEEPGAQEDEERTVESKGEPCEEPSETDFDAFDDEKSDDKGNGGTSYAGQAERNPNRILVSATAEEAAECGGELVLPTGKWHRMPRGVECWEVEDILFDGTERARFGYPFSEKNTAFVEEKNEWMFGERGRKRNGGIAPLLLGVAIMIAGGCVVWYCFSPLF